MGKQIWAFLKRPPLWFLMLAFLLTVGGVVLTVSALTIPQFPTVLAYASYGLAAVSLAYTIYTLVRLAPRLKQETCALIERHSFTRDLKENFGFRTLMLSIVSFAVSIAYGALNGVLGLLSLSVWYGALAAYYILLALLRGGILWHHAKSGRRNATEIPLHRAKTYRACGILLILLQIALSAAIVQMIFENRSFHYDIEWMVYAIAAYAFYKIIAAIINFFKAKGEADLTVEAIRNINLADATVSILALQTTLLGSYCTDVTLVSAFHTATGTVVSLFTLGLGVFMILKAQKNIKQLKSEKKHGE